MSLYSDTVDVLSPLVGRPAVEICLRSSAMKLGKSAEDFGPADVEPVLAEVRSAMSPFTSSALLDHAIQEIRMKSV